MNRVWRLVFFHFKDGILIIVLTWLFCLFWTFNLFLYHASLYREGELREFLQSIVVTAVLIYPSVFRVENFQFKLLWKDFYRKEIQFIHSFPISKSEIIHGFYLQYLLLTYFHFTTIFTLLDAFGLFERYQLAISFTDLINIILIVIGFSLLTSSISFYMQYTYTARTFYYGTWAYMILLYAIFAGLLLFTNKSIIQLLVVSAQQWGLLGGVITLAIGNLSLWISKVSVTRKLQ